MSASARLIEAIHALLAGTMLEYFQLDSVRERSGNKAPAFQPYDVFRASDGWIVPSVAQHHGLEWGAAEQAAFVDHYCGVLAETMVERKGELLPGVGELLSALDERDVAQGLGTGNFRRAAFVKLDCYGVVGHFLDGGFGDDSPDRPSLLAVGLERMRAHAAPEAGCVVIGDTVHDITAARAIGARVVAVKTGFAAPRELEEAHRFRRKPRRLRTRRAGRRRRWRGAGSALESRRGGRREGPTRGSCRRSRPWRVVPGRRRVRGSWGRWGGAGS